jgi:hypothetical protein
MKRYTVLGIALAMIILLVIAGVAFAAYSIGQSQSANNQTSNGYGRGMGRGMMGNPNTQPGGLASTNPTPSAPQANPIASPTPPSSNAPSANAATQKAGNLNVTLALTPYPPVSFQQTTFDITITDENGNAVSDAKVSLDLTMPSMPMPSNKPPAQSLGAGKYQALGRFTMRGGWKIAVIIERGSEKQTAFFQLGL